MKKLILPIMLAGALYLPAHAQNILVVDVGFVFNHYTEAMSEQEHFKNGVTAINTALEQRYQALSDLQNGMVSTKQMIDNPSLTAESKQTYQKELEDKTTQYNKIAKEADDFKQQSQNILNEQQNSIVTTEFKKIQAVCADIAKQHKADLVINTVNFTVVYNDKSMDITDDVVKKLNADAALTPAPTTTSAAASALPSAQGPSSTTPPPLGSTLPGMPSLPATTTSH